MTVLDARAVLALVQDEPGADLVGRELPGALLCTASPTQIVGKLVDVDLDPGRLAPLLRVAGVVVESSTERSAELAGALRDVARGRVLSLCDRSCLSLALRGPSGSVLTADRAWRTLDLPLTVRLIRRSVHVEPCPPTAGPRHAWQAPSSRPRLSWSHRRLRTSTTAASRRRHGVSVTRCSADSARA